MSNHNDQLVASHGRVRLYRYGDGSGWYIAKTEEMVMPPGITIVVGHEILETFPLTQQGMAWGTFNSMVGVS